MESSIKPGKFYGSSLPRPRIYTDVKFASDRVDPPVSVSDPLLSWANGAHWSMGGLSFDRPRLQGRIEGSIENLREENTGPEEKSLRTRLDAEKIRNMDEDEFVESEDEFVESEDEFEDEIKPEAGKKRTRKLVKESERVTDAGLAPAAYHTRNRGSNSNVTKSASEKHLIQKS